MCLIIEFSRIIPFNREMGTSFSALQRVIFVAPGFGSACFLMNLFTFDCLFAAAPCWCSQDECCTKVKKSTILKFRMTVLTDDW